MMDFIANSSLSNALAPKLEVGQEALYDALRARDETRATRIIRRVSGAGTRGSGQGSSRRTQEADLNAPDSRGLRPIHLAAMGGLSESVLALVEAGVPVDAMGTEGNTALHLAAFHQQEGVVAVLLRAGASPTHENIRGNTAVDLAKTDTTLTLLCPLHYSAGRGMLDNLVSLIAKGMPVNAVGKGDDIPLHTAAATGNTDAARLLLARGADSLRKNAAGETPLDLARRFGHGRELPGGGDGIVWVLQGAVAEAEAVAAASAAIEAERAAARARQTFREGEAVAYVRDGQEHPAVVMKVHQDDEEPYYTVRVHATGRERQTDASHLVRSRTVAAEAGGESGGESAGGDGAGTGSVDAPLEEGTQGQNGGSSVGTGGATDAAGVLDACGGSGDDWAAARALFLEVASEVGTAGMGGGPGGGGDYGSFSVARRLACAFAEVPEAEVRDILQKRVVGEKGRGREEGVADEVSYASYRDGAAPVGEGLGQGAQGSGGLKGGEADGQTLGGDRGRDRRRPSARAVADACRDIVLKCLLVSGKEGVGGTER